MTKIVTFQHHFHRKMKTKSLVWRGQFLWNVVGFVLVRDFVCLFVLIKIKYVLLHYFKLMGGSADCYNA